MKDHLHSNHILEDRIHIGDIPAILLRPKAIEKPLPTIIFYHGWGSSKESQRMRGLIYATVGFQVLIPDALYHGQRDPIDHRPENGKYFWKTIFNNVEESDILIGNIIKKYNGDPDNISVAGSSMGGFTAAGVFTHNPLIKSLIVFNGSCAWEDSNESLMKNLEILITDEIKEIQDNVIKLDPINHLDKLKDRDILMVHGEADSSVSIDSQRLFLKEISPLYKDKNRIKLIEYPNLNHYITTNMMEDSIKWISSLSE